MLKSYFKIAWRNIVRHKGYAAINVSGLTVGIAACLLIFVVLQFELSFETFRPNYKNIYHVVTQQKRESGFSFTPGVPVPATEALRLDFPQVKVAAINTNYGSQVTVPQNGVTYGANDKKFTEEIGVMFMEPQFFDIFQADWLAGSAAVLSEPNMVVIDKSTAAKYFGDWKDAMGKSLKMDNALNLKVAGVIEDSRSNTDFPLKVLVSFITWKQSTNYNYKSNNNWGSLSSNHQVFMLLSPGESPDKINAQLKTFQDRHSGDKHQTTSKIQFLQPLADMHFDTRFGDTLGDHITSKSTIRTLSFIAILIIIMASINFINLSTAQSVRRSKEVGIRKVLGSSRAQLIGQVIGETAIIVTCSVLLSIILAKLLLPYLKNVASVPDSINLLSFGSILFLLVVTVLVVLLSGIYPALVVSGFKPVLALKNKITAASIGGIPLRRVLVVTQFAISQFLIIGTLIAVKQMSFVNEADLGFNKDALLVIPGYTDSVSLQKIQSFKDRLLQNPDVKSVSFVSDVPSSDNNWGSNFYFDHSKRENGITTFLKYGDADYFKTFGLHFLAGHGFDQADTARQVVVNETFLKKLGINNPEAAIGKTIMGANMGTWTPIVGVVKDFKTNSLREEVKPIIMSPAKRFESEVAIKIQTHNLSKTVSTLQQLWENTYPEYAYNGYFLDDNIAKFYKQENQLALIYKIFAGIAVLISCLGLYGLVSFMVVQRTKEVGVRKVLGASVANIVYLFSKEFMLLIGISFLVAVPVAWYFMTNWLQNFVYRIHISADVFLLAIVSSVVLACLTVGYKAIKASLANPVKSLRSE